MITKTTLTGDKDQEDRNQEPQNGLGKMVMRSQATASIRTSNSSSIINTAINNKEVISTTKTRRCGEETVHMEEHIRLGVQVFWRWKAATGDIQSSGPSFRLFFWAWTGVA